MQLTFGGLAGVAIGSALGYGIGHLLATQGFSQVDAAACGTIAGCLSASMFALLYDRSVVADFGRSYRVLTAHIYPQTRSGPDYDPRERLALFGIPVAFATIPLPVAALFLWLAKQDPMWVGMYVVAGILAVVTTWVVGKATVEHRLLEREIAFNTTPAGPSSTAAAAAPPPVAKTKPPSPARARLQALFTIALSFLLVIFNHWSILHEHRYYLKAMFGAPMIMMVGVFALFEPRIMSRHLPVGKTYPKSVLLLTLLAMAIGLAAGYALYRWYLG